MAGTAGVGCGRHVQVSGGSKTPAVQLVEIAYEADDAIFPNPERGFFHSYQPTGGGRIGQQDKPHPPLKVEELRRLRMEEGITLVRDYILIPRKFWDEPISGAYFDEIQGNFDAIRAAGMKTIIRFLYDWGMTNRDPDEKTILRHLHELAPLIRKNADVIAWVQAGLFGGCGEANASDHNYVFDKHIRPKDGRRWQGLSPAGVRIYKRLLEILPPERMLAVRYPRLKWDMLESELQHAASRPPATQTAFVHQSTPGRIGFYNEGFMGNEDHYAMFVLPGEMEFASADSEFVVHEGEISNASPYKMKAGQVVADMTQYHVTALNRGGDEWPKVEAQWKANGDYDTVARRMGYRYRLVRAWLPAEGVRWGPLPVKVEIANDGFASCVNPRGLDLILRRVYGEGESPKPDDESLIVLREHPRGDRLFLPRPGQTKVLTIDWAVGNVIPPGRYELLLALPDPAEGLSRRPEYSIRLANKGLWEEKTGYNRLNHTVTIRGR